MKNIRAILQTILIEPHNSIENKNNQNKFLENNVWQYFN